MFAAAFSFAMISVALLATAVSEKYGWNIMDLSSYPALLPIDFQNGKLLRSDKAVVFFYAQWCPFCQKSFHLLKSLNKSQSKVFRADLSDEDNPLWDSLGIKVVPTLIAFRNGTEFWRADGITMVGLRKKDFERAAIAAN